MDHRKIIIDRQFLDGLMMPVFIKRADGVLVYCNQFFFEFFGEQKTCLEDLVSNTLVPDKIAKLLKNVDEVFLNYNDHQGASINLSLDKYGLDKVLDISIIYEPDNKVAGLFGIINTQDSSIKSLPAKFKCFTSREIEILQLVVKGESTKSIAQKLGISPHTVAHYLKKLYVKMGVHSRNQAFFKALDLFDLKFPQP